jgi:hypothetical protein
VAPVSAVWGGQECIEVAGGFVGTHRPSGTSGAAGGHSAAGGQQGGVAAVQRPQAPRGLWTVLRVAMLHSIWAVRCAAKHQQGVFTRQAVGAVFVREVRGMLLGDWARVQGDIRLMAGVPPSWFRGRDRGGWGCPAVCFQGGNRFCT